LKAAAPASRNDFQYIRTELLPPVNCAPNFVLPCDPISTITFCQYTPS
jgi:hypothetical protein